MWEVLKEFAGTVISGTGEELRRAGSTAAVVFFCMLAFLCIAAGIFAESRCAMLYYLTPDGKRKLIGSIFIQKVRESYRVKIPSKFFEKSESIYYYLQLPEAFTHRHYMEEMQIELPAGRRRLPIKRQIQFKIGLH